MCRLSVLSRTSAPKKGYKFEQKFIELHSLYTLPWLEVRDTELSFQLANNLWSDRVMHLFNCTHYRLGGVACNTCILPVLQWVHPIPINWKRPVIYVTLHQVFNKWLGNCKYLCFYKMYDAKAYSLTFIPKEKKLYKLLPKILWSSCEVRRVVLRIFAVNNN